MSRRYFLIVSNMRSGSTLLETMLGALDGVFSDREVKWKPRVAGQRVHLPVSEETHDLQQLFEQVLVAGDATLVGSKLVIDPYLLPEQAQLHLRTIIPEDWYIIHLTRPYRDVFLSRQRGAEHLRNKSGVPIKGPRLGESLTTAPISNESSVATKYIDRETCFRELNVYLSNDLWVSSLAQGRDRYFQIDYRDIFSRFRELIRFLGLDPATPDVTSVIKSPPLQKLPPVSPGRLVANIADLEPVFDAIEDIRHLLILDQPILRSFLPDWQSYQARGDTRFSQGDFAGAIADYSVALKGSPPNQALYRSRGQVYEAEGNFAGAITEYTLAMDGVPSDPSLYFLRGSAKLKLSDYNGAIKDFEGGLRLDPDNGPLHELLRVAKTNINSHITSDHDHS